MSWHRKNRTDLDNHREYNLAGMTLSGFEVDKGKVLSQEEISKIQLTPPDQIRDSRITGPYHWR